jgi:hypothetical protein
MAEKEYIRKKLQRKIYCLTKEIAERSGDEYRAI